MCDELVEKGSYVMKYVSIQYNTQNKWGKTVREYPHLL